MGVVHRSRRGANVPFPASAGACRRCRATTAASTAEGARRMAAKAAARGGGSGTFLDPQACKRIRDPTSIHSLELRPRRWKMLRRCKFGGQLQAEEGTTLLAEGGDRSRGDPGWHKCSQNANAKAREWVRCRRSCCHKVVLFKEEREGEATA